MTAYISVSDLEQATLSWFTALGYEILDRDNLDPESVHQERTAVDQVILEGRLRAALDRLNPEAPPEAIDETIRTLRRHDAPTLIQNNLAFHRMLTDGISVEVADQADGIRGVLVRLVDAEHPDANDWMVTSQLDVVDRATGTGRAHRPDIIVYVNGLPLAVIELKNPTSSSADVDDAYNQLQTYIKDIPSLFATNCALVISDDVHARIGPLSAPFSRFAPWRTIGGKKNEPAGSQPLQVLIVGVFAKRHFLDLCQSFITFERDRGRIVKKLAGYHQFHAVRLAVEKTAVASARRGNRKIGVIWHTQGSGKSLTMVFYAGKLVCDPRMENPTLVVLTDRNDLDDQLFATFAQSRALLRQDPIQARDREHLRELLTTTSGGVYFTTAQKFLPEGGERKKALSERRNIVVIADEAHRSQYGFKERVDDRTGKKTWGFAVHMRDALPKASFIGFTGTPVDLKDRSTVHVFGDTISIYDIQRAVEDHATVAIYYEARQTRLELDERERPRIDPAFEEVTEGEEAEQKEALKSEWSAVEAVAGTRKRVGLVAADLVVHFEKRLGAIEGKALVVCMSRRICVELYDAMVKLRPAWHDEDDDAGAIKVVMTGSAEDPEALRAHLHTKAGRARLADRFKDPADPLRIVIVRDMWLTGFDAPCLHTLYVDKPMQGHNLLQAIARVNRVFGDKTGGLVVDYFGIEGSLKHAIKAYRDNGGQGRPTIDQVEAITAMRGQLWICQDLFHGFDYRPFLEGGPAERLAVLPRARDHVLGLRAPQGDGAAKGGKKKRRKREPDGYDRFMRAVTDLSAAFSLAVPHEECETIRSEVAFFQAVRAGLVKLASPRRLPMRELGHAVRQIVENAILPGQVVDVFEAAGVGKPDLSILSEAFLAEIRAMPLKNLAAELLRRLLEDEVAVRSRRSLIQGRLFSELLERALARYRNRSIDSAAVIEELIEIAQAMAAADEQADKLSLSREELAFYEALADNRSAAEKLGDTTLSDMARDLAALVRKSATLDWTHKRTVQADLRRKVRRLLKERGYPPDAAPKATDTVLEQAKLLGINVVEGGSEATGEPGSWADPPEVPAAAPPPAPPPKPLPYPIAVFDRLVESQETAMARVKMRLGGVEFAFALLAAALLGWLREEGGGTLPAEASEMLGKIKPGQGVSMGAWVDLACRLSVLVPEAATDPIARAARSLVTGKDKPSDIAMLARAAVTRRNDLTHTNVSEAGCAAMEGEVHAAGRRIEGAFIDLSACEMISLVTIEKADFKTGTTRCRVRVHQGAQSLFEIKTREVRGSLDPQWCYLLREGKPPLSLSPLLLCMAAESGGHDVFLVRVLGVRPGENVEIAGVTGIKMKVALPE